MGEPGFFFSPLCVECQAFRSSSHVSEDNIGLLLFGHLSCPRVNKCTGHSGALFVDGMIYGWTDMFYISTHLLYLKIQGRSHSGNALVLFFLFPERQEISWHCILMTHGVGFCSVSTLSGPWRWLSSANIIIAMCSRSPSQWAKRGYLFIYFFGIFISWAQEILK